MVRHGLCSSGTNFDLVKRSLNQILDQDHAGLVNLRIAWGGEKGGLDPRAILSYVSKGSGDCYALREKLPRMIDHDFKPGFAMEMAYKDLSLALQTASELEVALPLAALGRELYGFARKQGKSKMDTSALITFYGELKK